MFAITLQRHPWAVLVGLVALVIGGMTVAGLGAARPESVLIFWLALGGLAGLGYYAVKGDLLTAILVWLVSLIVLHEEFWRVQVPYFFSLTIPRIGIVVLALLFVAMLAIGRFRLCIAWPISALVALVAGYFFLSALWSGFQTRSVVSVHYRLIGGYLFPFTVFMLVLHAFRAPRDARRLGLFFAALSVYLTFTGWCEQLDWSDLIVPAFIDDPNVGIHWGRVRGPFVMSAAMGLTLVYCFYSNLVLARTMPLGGWILRALNLAMLPVIFWTKTRSVWLSFVVCGVIWAVYAQRRIPRIALVSVLISAALLVCVLNMRNFLSEDRDKGGLMDAEPILLRIGLARMTWEIVREHPLTGVGFGHFRDHAPAFARDPSSPFYAFGTTALEHNNLLSIAAETGLFGVALYVAMMALILRRSVRAYRRIPTGPGGPAGRDGIVLYWILAAAYLIDGTFRETSDNPFANCLFFGLSAVPLALEHLARRAGAETRPARANPAFSAGGTA